MTMVWLSCSGASCNEDEAWLELDGPTARYWTQRGVASTERAWRRWSYHGVREIEASTVARSSGSRHTGVPLIPRRSSCAATARSGRGQVRVSGEKGGVKQCQGGAPEHGEEVGLGGRSGGLVPYCEPAALSEDWWRRGGFWLRSLGASSARVWEGEVCGREGVL
jgi:hypothetical protein